MCNPPIIERIKRDFVAFGLHPTERLFDVLVGDRYAEAFQ
jgi:hypothetical protein